MYIHVSAERKVRDENKGDGDVHTEIQKVKINKEINRKNRRK